MRINFKVDDIVFLAKEPRTIQKLYDRQFFEHQRVLFGRTYYFSTIQPTDYCKNLDRSIRANQDFFVISMNYKKVEPMGREADEIQIAAIVQALYIPVRLVNLVETHCFTEKDLPKGSIPQLHVLHRPNFFGILYN